jgi:hypothetical protein
VTSEIPQGSVLFKIYINDLPYVVQNIAKLFADDTKLYAVVNKEEEQHSLQNDINNLVHWSDKWLLKFNKSKCKYVHLGHATNTKYKMGENEINQVTEEKDLEVLIDDKLKFQQHINQQTKKANQRLGMIKRSFSYMEKEMFITLLQSIVRPYLEYGSNVWSVIYKKKSCTNRKCTEERPKDKLVKKYTTSELHRMPEIYWIAITSIQKTESRHG